MNLAIVSILTIIECAILVYIIKLLSRIGWLNESYTSGIGTSVSLDVIYLIYLSCIVSILVSLYLWKMTKINRVIVMLLLGCALLQLAVFSYLNFTGKVALIKKHMKRL